MRVTLVECKDRQATVKYEELQEDGGYRGFVCMTPPGEHLPPEFEAALRRVRTFLPKLYGWPQAAGEGTMVEWTENGTVWGLSLSYPGAGAGKMTAVVKYKHRVPCANGPLNMPSPPMVRPDDIEGTVWEAIDELLTQAMLIAEGAKAQQELELGVPRRAPAGTRPKGSSARRFKASKAFALEALRQVPRIALATEQQADELSIDDDELTMFLLDAFDAVEYVDEDDRKHPGLIRVSRETSEKRYSVMWCGVSTEGGVPRLFVDIDPQSFAPAAIATHFIGMTLCGLVREVWGTNTEPTSPLDDDEEPEAADPAQSDLIEPEDGAEGAEWGTEAVGSPPVVGDEEEPSPFDQEAATAE